MNNDFHNQNLLKSSNISPIMIQQNNLNPLQFVSTPNFQDYKNSNNNINNTVNFDLRNDLNVNNEQNNGLNNNYLNISENELFNFELDQSTESIITNQSIKPQIQQESSSITKNIDNNGTKAENVFISNINKEGNKNMCTNNNNEIDDNLKYKDMLKNLEEKLRNEYLVNKEQNNYIEILKQTINNCLLKNGNITMNSLDNASKQLNKNPIDILAEYTSLKSQNETIKKQLVMQQILYKDMKNEITNLKNENNILKNTSEKLNKENKALKKIKEEISHNYDMLVGESIEIKNNLLKYEEEFTNCAKNNSDYLRLKTEHSDLSTNYEKQRNMLVNLQNDFNKINKSNNELSKYNEKLVKENQQLKRELFLKSNELDNINNKISSNMNDIKENNDILMKEKNDLINNMKIIENKNAELNNIKDNQKIEIDSLNKIINEKNNEILKYLKEIECFKNNPINTFSKNNNNNYYDNREKLNSEINLDLIINNVQNELSEKNKLIEDLKAENARLIKENNENNVNDFIIKENNKKNEVINEDKKYLEQIDKLNTIIKQKELEIYTFKSNEKSYNKIIDVSFLSIREFINNIKNYDEFKENDEEIINLEINDTNSENNNIFSYPLKEFVNKMNEENKNNNNYYNGNGSNFPLIEKMKKINIFINIIPNEIINLHHKIKSIHQENEALLNIKNKTKNKSSNINIIDNTNNNNNNLNDINNLSSIINFKKIINNIDISQSTPSIIDTDKKYDNFGDIKRYNTNIDTINNNQNNNNNNDNNSIFMDNNELKNIQNMKSIKSKRNNILDLNYSPSENINLNLKSIFDEEKDISNKNSNFLSNKNKPSIDESRVSNSNIKLNKINLKVKEINNLIFNEEDNYNNYNNYKNGNKSRISLFKEGISNKNTMDNRDIRDNQNIFLSLQTSPEIQRRANQNKIYNETISQNNDANIRNNPNLNYVNNLNINKPVTNRPIQSRQNNAYFNIRNGNKKNLEDLNVSSNMNNILNCHTVDSSRYNTNTNINSNIIPSLNDNAIFNRKKSIEDKNKKNELYQKNINGLADEVMKPSFLKSDVSMTMLGSGINNNNSNSNESFLFLARNKLNQKHKQNTGCNFIEIKSNSKKKSSQHNSNNDNKNDLQKNKSFLY